MQLLTNTKESYKSLTDQELAKKQGNDALRMQELVREAGHFFGKALTVINTLSNKVDNLRVERERLKELQPYLDEISKTSLDLQDILSEMFDSMELADELTASMREEALKILGENRLTEEIDDHQYTLFNTQLDPIAEINIYERKKDK